ncbi:kinase-like domain-containing protein [Earliella scabrosa]|nr:kinase-like domain-containing protein [Earliella scabrosa]
MAEDDIRAISKQLLDAITFLHSLHIIHTDVKSDNILLCNSGASETFRDLREGPRLRFEIRIIDLEDARVDAPEHYGMAGSYRYRAPEVTLGMKWSDKVDSFSVGCVLAELWRGDPLFPATETAAERMLAVDIIIGPIPMSLVSRMDAQSRGLFEIDGERVRVKTPRRDVRRAVRRKKIQLCRHLSSLSMDEEARQLCFELLSPDPNGRLPVSDALMLPFFHRDGRVVPKDPVATAARLFEDAD